MQIYIHSSSSVWGDSGKKGMTVMEQTKDRRIQRTRAVIHRAFLELIQEKELARITVKELVERADVNRKTFYNHYNDIYEVLDDIEDEWIGGFVNKIRGMGSAILNQPQKLMHEAIRELQENQSIYYLLMYSGDRSNILNKVVSEEKKMLQEYYDKNSAIHEEWLDYFLNFFASGSMAVFETWIKSSNRPPIQDVTAFFEAFLQMFREQWMLGERKIGNDQCNDLE